MRLYAGKINVSSVLDLAPLRRATSDASGLSLASDPTGTVNFLDMVNNLEGDSGRGYYIEMSIGSPGQKVTWFGLRSFVQVNERFHQNKRTKS